MNSIRWIPANAGPVRIWRSDDGRYAIIAHTLPEHPPSTEYQARKIDPAMARAYPDSNTLGYLLGTSPWCWNTENSVHSAEAIINRDAYRSAHSDSVPADHPAVALERFYWPISNGTSRAALAVAWKDNALVAQVLGMTVRDRAAGYRPEPWVEIDLTALGLVPSAGAELPTTTDHGPPPCGNCGVKVGQPHAPECDDSGEDIYRG